MQRYTQPKIPVLLVAGLLGIGLVIMTSTFFGKETVKVVTDIIYIPITAIFVGLSLILAMRFKKTGSHGKAWLFFFVTAVSWFIAETTWTVSELVYDQKPFPSLADVFYLSGYLFLFCFLVYYLKPVITAVTRKLIISVVVVSALVAIPSLVISYNYDPQTPLLENVLATAYPIADAFVFAPALIGIVLFFRGEVNFTWSLICLGIALLIIGDAGFQVTTFTNTYYTGHPVDIIYLWSYLFFSYGVYSHIQIFKKDKVENMDKLRGR